MRSVVEWSGVARTFSGTPEVKALQPADLVVQDGEFHAILGKSGSGKSTILNLLGLLDTPTSGKYLFLGKDVSHMRDRDRSHLRLHSIAYIFQSFYLIDGRSVLENVALPLLYRGILESDRKRCALEAVERVGLTHRLNADVTTLSGGERQRAAIARSMIGRPKLLLCDEPTGNLDSDNANHILDMIEDLNHEGTAVIIVTHDPAAASRANVIWRVHNGELKQDPRTI